jgi:hypothetical protein
MKITRYIAILLLFVAASVHFSCSTEVEPIDPAVLDPEITSCSKPTGFHVSDFVNGNTINLNWIAGGSETAWEIEYGPAGFEPGTGATVTAETTNYTIDGLDNTIAYEF